MLLLKVSFGVFSTNLTVDKKKCLSKWNLISLAQSLQLISQIDGQIRSQKFFEDKQFDKITSECHF